ncbi:MAG TPA: FadR/GntR family transcriptional regulator [Terriglobales bacterium]|nr:FadR/GntR family transcriptional regulator [Terriglobales bacterium]
MNSDLGPIRKRKIYEQVARQIRDRVLNKLNPGDKLPPERELAERLGVSRSSVRDAIRSLELVGAVEPRSGAGTVVREMSADWIMSPVANVLVRKPQLLGDLLDFRKILEPPLAALAAKHASRKEIHEMEAILRRQEEKVRRGEVAIEEDSQFHYAIARASENTVVLKVLDALMDLLLEVRERSLQVEGRPQKSSAGHWRILRAIQRHDATAAHKAMRRHIEDVEEIVLNKF